MSNEATHEPDLNISRGFMLVHEIETGNET